MRIHPLRLTLLFLAPLSSAAVAQRGVLEAPHTTGETSFAIVIDRETFAAAEEAARAYAHAVEADGLPTYLAVDDWESPEAVRSLLEHLHRGERKLEGALLVGKIPVAMLREAQHLSSAFKMDPERFPRRRSSIPSDRFYEDFDLLFSDLGSDEEDPLLRYYALLPESEQHVTKEIYTARLLAPVEGDDGHAMIRRCLERFATERGSERPTLDRALVFLGHGYLSESLTAWADMQLAFREQFPALYAPGGRVASYHHASDPALEATLLRELRDPALDLAVLHHHGAPDTQYLLGAPPVGTITARIESVQLDLRTRLRRARAGKKNEAELQLDLMERLGVPLPWFERAFDPEQTQADEALAAMQDVTVDELSNFACGASVVILDSCFNGRFVDRPYLAARYLLGPGATRVVVANSVNVAQDVWNDAHLELLGRGVRVGHWHRLRPHLESHVLGDPTFRFAPLEAANPSTDLDLEDPARVLREDPVSIHRLAALATLASSRDPRLASWLPLAAHDPSELVRRRAVDLMGDVGNDTFIASLLHAILRDPSERVVFQARGALHKYDPTIVERVADPVLTAEARLYEDPSWRERMERSLGPGSFIAGDLAAILDGTLQPKKRIGSIRTFRLYRVHQALPRLCDLASRNDDATVRTCALECLGWYVYHEDRARIVETCERIVRTPGVPAEVRAEARKTARRILAGANDPLLP